MSPSIEKTTNTTSIMASHFKCPKSNIQSPIKQLIGNNMTKTNTNTNSDINNSDSRLVAETQTNNNDKKLQLTPFQRLLKRLNVLFSQAGSAVDADEVYRILEDYNSNRCDWDHYAFYDPTCYKRNLVDEGKNYNVMILGWGPGVSSSIHDHPGAHCFMKVLEGELVESKYAWPSKSQAGESFGEMKLISEARSTKNEVIYINDNIGLHRVSNPDKLRNCTSLHVYVPPFKQCRTFDQKTSQARECKMTFYSKRGIVIGGQQQQEKPTS